MYFKYTINILSLHFLRHTGTSAYRHILNYVNNYSLHKLSNRTNYGVPLRRFFIGYWILKRDYISMLVPFFD